MRSRLSTPRPDLRHPPASAAGSTFASPARAAADCVERRQRHLCHAWAERRAAAEHRNPDSAGLNARIPLYRAASRARIRAAQARGPVPRADDRHERAVISKPRSAYASYQAAQNAIASTRSRCGPRTGARRCPRRAERGTRPYSTSSCEQELLLRSGAGDRPARRLCRRLPAAQRDGPGGGDDLGLEAGRSTTRSAITAASPETGTTGPTTAATTRSRPAPSLRAKRPCRSTKG